MIALTLALDFLLLQLDSLNSMLHIRNSLLGTHLLIPCCFFKHDDFEFHLAFDVLQFACFRLERSQFYLIFFHHFLFDSLIFLVQFKCVLLVDCE